MRSERREIWNGLIFAGFFVMLAFVSVGCASAATRYVNPGDLIQDAVDVSNPFDTIIVRDGTYTENVDVNVDNLAIRSENGADSTIVQAANSNDHIFDVNADYVDIYGFTLSGAISLRKAGYISEVPQITAIFITIIFRTITAASI